jgi:hypothetical protein
MPISQGMDGQGVNIRRKCGLRGFSGFAIKDQIENPLIAMLFGQHLEGGGFAVPARA